MEPHINTIREDSLEYHMQIVCRENKCTIAEEKTTVKGTDEEIPIVVDLHPGDALVFSIDDPADGDDPGNFAIVAVVQAHLVTEASKYLKVEIGKPGHIVIRQDLDASSKKEALHLMLYCASCSCNCPPLPGEIPKAVTRRYLVDPRPRKGPTTSIPEAGSGNDNDSQQGTEEKKDENPR